METCETLLRFAPDGKQWLLDHPRSPFILAANVDFFGRLRRPREALCEKTYEECKMTEKCSKFIIFKSRFLREKILFFVQVFFPGKIWIYTFDCARFYHISVHRATLAKEPVCISKYFRKSADFREYLDIHTGSLAKVARCPEI